MRLQSDVKNIYNQLDKHEDKFDKLNDINIVLERTVTVLEELREDRKGQKKFNGQITDTLSAIQSTMIETTFNMKELVANQEQTNARISSMSKEYNSKFDDTYDRIEKTTQQLLIVDGKGKFDFIDYFKAKVLPILIGAGALGGFYALIQNLLS